MRTLPAAPRELRAPPRARADGDAARRSVVRWVMLIYLLAIFEGSLRKWVVPEFGQALFFIRDPVLVLVYVQATRHRLWPRGSWPFTLTLALAAFGGVLALLQIATQGVDNLRLLLAAYGYRNYFLYAPLAFLVGAQFRRDDLQRLFRWTLWLTLPMALLVALQFSSPLGAPINAGISEDVKLQYRGLTVNADTTRPQGTFSSGAGQQQFVVTSFAILLALLLTSAPRRGSGRVLLVLATAGVLTCIGLSGSRGTMLHCGLVVAAAASLAAVGQGAALRSRALLLPLALTAAAVLLYPVVFPKGAASFLERWEAADRVESRHFEGGVFGRALYGLVDFTRLLGDTPLLGYGLGYGGNASLILRANVDGVVPGMLAETDWARHVVDLGPPAAFGFIAYRLLLVGWLGARVLRSTLDRPDPIPMLLYAYAGVTLLTGQITGQGAINVYGWLFAGLCIASTSPGPLAAARRLPALATRSRFDARRRNDIEPEALS